MERDRFNLMIERASSAQPTEGGRCPHPAYRPSFRLLQPDESRLPVGRVGRRSRRPSGHPATSSPRLVTYAGLFNTHDAGLHSEFDLIEEAAPRFEDSNPGLPVLD